MSDETSRFTSDRRSPEEASWVGQPDWEAGTAENVDVTTEGVVGRAPVQDTETLASAISHFEDETLDSSHSEWGRWSHRGDGGHVLDGNSEMYGTYSLRNDWSGGINSFSEIYRNTPVTADFRYSIKLSNQSGHSNDDCTVDFIDSSGSSGGSWLDWRQNGNIVWRPRDGSGEVVLQSWSADTVYDVKYYVDYNNGTVDIDIDGTLYENLNWQPDRVDRIRFRNQHNHSGQSCSFWIDELHEE
jgi:hypothetical protein